MTETIHAFIRRAIDNYEKEEPEIVDGLTFNTFNILKEVEYMANNRYLLGEKDENDNYKPFYNITTRLLNNQKSAEDIDRKDMVITTDNPNYFGRAFLLNKFNQSWMRRAKLARVLNDFTETRGKYGGVLLKKTEGDGELYIDVVDWHNVIVDQIDIKSGAIIENKYYTPAELIKEAQHRGWDMEEVKRAIELYTEEDQDDMLRAGNTAGKKEAISGYILVRECYAVMEKSMLDEDAEEHDYSMQIHVVAGSEIVDDKGQDKGVVLFQTELKESPFKYLPYRKRSVKGSELGVGIVEEARQAQIWTNYGIMAEKNALDFGSKVAVQTASKKFKGKNVLTDFKNGAIFEHEEGKPFTSIDLTPKGIGQLQNFMVQWEEQITKALNVSDVSTGQDTQSGTPYRLGALLDQNAQSVYNQRREEAGDFWNEVYAEWVIPYLIKQIKKEDSIVAELTPDEMMRIDEDFAAFTANGQIIQNLLDGKYDGMDPAMRLMVLEEEQNAIKMQLRKRLQRQKNKREFSFPEGYWDKDVVFQLDVQISNEQKQKQAFLETRSNILTQYLQYAPMIKADPAARKIFEGLVEASGMSSIDFDFTPTPNEQMQQPGQPQPQQQQQPQIETAKPQWNN